MKTEKWMPTATLAVLLVAATSCGDWGKQDPLLKQPSGADIGERCVF